MVPFAKGVELELVVPFAKGVELELVVPFAKGVEFVVPFTKGVELVVPFAKYHSASGVKAERALLLVCCPHST